MKLTKTIVLIFGTLSVCAIADSQSQADNVAAKFFRGDGLGEAFSLDIKSGGRFTYVMDTDLGNLERAEGTVETIGGRLWFSPNAESRIQADSRLLGWWVPVAWGERRYLIEEREMLPFVNDVNLGTEPRTSTTGSYLLRRGDAERPVKGSPSVPEEWRAYILSQRVAGVITNVIDDRNAEIDIGRRNGLRSGMVLMAFKPSRGWLDVTVTSVTPSSSRVSAESGEPPLFVGQRVTSRP